MCVQIMLDPILKKKKYFINKKTVFVYLLRALVGLGEVRLGEVRLG
jgi:hypothetical protein